MATLKSLLPKTVYIISNDPSASFFVISLSALVICCPLLALYISKANEVSDIDTVKGFNTYLRSFSYKEFCIGELGNISSYHTFSQKNHNHLSTTLKVFVKKTISFNGFIGFSLVDDQISVIGKNVSITIFVNTSSIVNNNCDRNWCVLFACAVITVPFSVNGLQSLRSCLVQGDYFTNKVYYPDHSCATVLKINDNEFRKHDVIIAYLQLDDKRQASSNLYRSTWFFSGLLLAFIIAVSCNKVQNN